MLARNAESLYWIGRYVERADDTARILDVSVHQLLEDATVDTDRAARTLLGVLGCDAMARGPARRLVGRPSSSATRRRPAGLDRLVGLPRPGRTPAGPARWSPPRCGSASTPRGTPCPSAAYAGWVGPHAFFSYVEDRAAMFSGLAASTMSRDDTWRFYLLGRSVERVDMVVRLLLSRVSDRMSSPGWLTVLRGRRPGHLPAHLPRCARRGAGRPVPADGQAVPPLGVPRAAAGRDLPDRAGQPADRPDRGQGRGAAAARPGAQRAGVPAPGRAADDLPTQLTGLQETIRDVGEAVSLPVLPRRPLGGVDRSGRAGDSVTRGRTPDERSEGVVS